MKNDEGLTVLQRVRRFTGFAQVDPNRSPDGFGHESPNLENAARLLDEPGKVIKPPKRRVYFTDVFLVVFFIVLAVTVAEMIWMVIK